MEKHMPRSRCKQIDLDERILLEVLKKNSGESIEHIVKKCGFSRQKVWRIKKRLEKNKIIWGYNAVVDNEKFGRTQYFILIKRTINHITEKKINLITNRILKKEAAKIDINIESSYFVHGSFDWILYITANNSSHVKKFCNLIITIFAEGFISDIQVLEVLFPVEKNNCTNPNLDEIRGFFLCD